MAIKHTLTYKDFFTDEENEVFIRMKKAQASFAREARDIVASMVGGKIGDPNGSEKEFLITDKGLYRLYLGSHSDNTTETAAHDRMGATPVNMGREDTLAEFFKMHGHDTPVISVTIFRRDLRARLNEES